jgi:serine/threonine-protein kinase
MVLSELGQGGMGSVYLAHDRNLDTQVVIKVPRSPLLDEVDFAARFQREICSLVKLVHPHIVKILDAGEEDGLPFGVMQYLPGGSLSNRYRFGKPVHGSVVALLDWLPDIADALDYIHANGYIHRDIKPDNILFDADGRAYLGDFGIAKVIAERTSGRAGTFTTVAGMVLGTPHYMAPELIMGQSYDGRIDQYALAIVVYQVLSGQLPFDAPNATTIFVQHTTHATPRLSESFASISKRVSDAVYRAMAKDPTKRFPDCAAFARAVLAPVTGEPAGVGDPPRPAGKPAPATRTAIACPACGRNLRVNPEVFGKRVRCSGCGATFRAGFPDDAKVMNADRPLTPAQSMETPSPNRPRLETVRDFLSDGIHDSSEDRPKRNRHTLAIAVTLVAVAFLIGLLSLFVATREHKADTAVARVRDTETPPRKREQVPAKPEPLPPDSGVAGKKTDADFKFDLVEKPPVADRPKTETSLPPPNPRRETELNPPEPSRPIEPTPTTGKTSGALERWTTVFSRRDDFNQHWKRGVATAQFNERAGSISVLSSRDMGTIEFDQPWSQLSFDIWGRLPAPAVRGGKTYINLDVHVNGAQFLVRLTRGSSPAERTQVSFVNENGRIVAYAKGRPGIHKDATDPNPAEKLACRFASGLNDVEIVISNVKLKTRAR